MDILYLNGSQSFAINNAATQVYRSLYCHHILMKIHLNGQIFLNSWLTFPYYPPGKLHQFILLSQVWECYSHDCQNEMLSNFLNTANLR